MVADICLPSGSANNQQPLAFFWAFCFPLSLPWDWPLNLAAVLVTRSLLLRSPPHKAEVENKLISARQNRRALCLDLRIIIQLARLNSTPFEWLMKDSLLALLSMIIWEDNLLSINFLCEQSACRWERSLSTALQSGSETYRLSKVLLSF